MVVAVPAVLQVPGLRVMQLSSSSQSSSAAPGAALVPEFHGVGAGADLRP